MKHKLLFAFIGFFMTTFSYGQSLIGEWKFQQVRTLNQATRKVFIINIAEPEMLKKDLYKAYMQEPQEEGEELNNKEIKEEIKKIVTSYMKARVTLMENGKFTMVSNGVIVPTAVPGFHFGDSLAGNWQKDGNMLILTVGDEKVWHSWKFKIHSITARELKLIELLPDGEEERNEFQFLRK